MSYRKALVPREDFPSLARESNGKPLRYFDGPAGVQVPQKVIDAIGRYYSTCNANLHGTFQTSKETEQLLADSRAWVSEFLGAPGPDCISFGANMTSLNFPLSHAISRLLSPGDEVLITQLDHEANRGPWLRLRDLGIEVREVPLRADGTLDYGEMAQRLSERTRVVAIGYASNALGTVNDLTVVREMTRKVGAWMVVDAVHSTPHFVTDFQALDVEFLLCSAYKFYGPHVGILCTQPNLLEHLDTDRLRTQSQKAPYRVETGTLNHAALAGVRASLEYLADLGDGDGRRARLVSGMRRVQDHERALAELFYSELEKIPGVTLYGPSFDSGPRAPTISFRIEGLHPREVASCLGQKGFLVWDGHFYAIRAMEVLGLSGSGGVVRVGMSIYLGEDEVRSLVEEIQRLAAEVG